MNAARSLHDRLWERFQRDQSAESVRNVTCARKAERPLSSSLSNSLYAPKSSPRARVTNRTLRDAEVITLTDRPRWSDLSSALFWLRHREWPALEVGGVVIEGEPAWRAWVGRAQTEALLAVRDRVAV